MIIRLRQGFHGGGGANNMDGWREWWQTLNNAGYPVNAIFADNAGPLWEIQDGDLHPDNVLIFRYSVRGSLGLDPNSPNYLNDPMDEADRMYTAKYSDVSWPSDLDKNFIWLKDTNEIRTKLGEGDRMWGDLPVGEWWGRYAKTFAENAVRDNHRVILLSPSSGDHERDFWNNPAMLDFLQFAIDNPANVAVGLHEYSYTTENIIHPFTPDTYQSSLPENRKIGRFELLFNICDENSLGGWPMIYFPEWGWTQNHNAGYYKSLDDIRFVTENVYGPYYKYILGFGTWYLGTWQQNTIGNETQPLIRGTMNITLNETFDVEERFPAEEGENMCECNAIQDTVTVSIWIPQFNQLNTQELDQVISWAADGFTKPDGTRTSGEHMLCPSHVDALRIHTQGLPGSVLAVAYPERIGTGVTLDWIRNNCPCALEDGRQVVFLGTSGVVDNPFERLPVDEMRLSQLWGANPDDYAQFNLPGHEGIDVPIPNGTPVYAGVSGRVSQTATTGNYGNSVRVQTTLNGETYEVIYAHLQSINVAYNQGVTPNTVIGLSNNTGNSSGPHLHLAVKVLGKTYVDSFGVWPYNFHNPMLWLAELYSERINGMYGNLWLSGLKVDDTSNIAYAVGNLNLRENPSSTSALLGVVPNGSIVEILSAPVNGYVWCKTTLVDEPPTVSTTDYGLHVRADPSELKPAEYDIISRMLNDGGKTVKVAHSHPDSVYNRIVAMRPDYVMVRVMQSWGGRNVTPRDFYNWTVDDLVRKINILNNAGIRAIVEVHNEPNLRLEGMWLSWNNGAEFATFINTVIALYKGRPELAHLTYIYPGLSPGGDMTNVRYDSIRFLTESVAQGINVDGLGVHAYWSDTYSMSAAIDSVIRAKAITGNIYDTYVTEVSRNDRPATQSADTYGREYARFTREVPANAVYFFVGSASDTYFAPETWVREDNVDKGIAYSFLSNL